MNTDTYEEAPKEIWIYDTFFRKFSVFFKNRYEETHIPRHDAMKLIANCEQKIMLSRSRRLIVMEKERDCKTDDRAYVLDESYAMENYREKAVS